MIRMLRPTLANIVVMSLVAVMAGCAKAPPPAAPPQAAYVPPPLPEPPPARWCARQNEVAAFSVAALKSELMVAAVSCHADDQYNDFIRRNRSVLVAEEKTSEGYFSRNDRAHWQRTRDDYITQLANAQSQRAMVLGNQFCQRIIGQFDEIAALSGPEQLATYAASKSAIIPQPMKFSDCPASAPAKPVAHKAAKSK
jgi:hypothetical protein